MAITNQNGNIYVGDDTQLQITIYQENGVDRLRLGDFRFTWIMAEKPGKPALLTKTLESGGISVLDANNGLLGVTITRAESARFLGDKWHQLEVIDSSGDVVTVTTGKLFFLKRTAN